MFLVTACSSIKWPPARQGCCSRPVRSLSQMGCLQRIRRPPPCHAPLPHRMILVAPRMAHSHPFTAFWLYFCSHFAHTWTFYASGLQLSIAFKMQAFEQRCLLTTKCSHLTSQKVMISSIKLSPSVTAFSLVTLQFLVLTAGGPAYLSQESRCARAKSTPFGAGEGSDVQNGNPRII